MDELVDKATKELEKLISTEEEITEDKVQKLLNEYFKEIFLTIGGNTNETST